MKKRLSWLAAACTGFVILAVRGPDTFAAGEICRAGEGREAEITIRSEWLSGNMEEYEPENVYTDENGDQYELKDWSTVPDVLEERTIKRKADFLYEKCEGKKMIPETCRSSFDDPVTGRDVLGICRMEDMAELEELWSDNFVFTAVFHGYDSDLFQLGSKEIPFNEERPGLEEYEAELLAQIGVPSSDYRILGAEWQGPPYTDENGILCRTAVVTGEKKVWNYQVHYSGNITFPQISGFRCTAVYGQREKETSEPEPVEMAETEETKTEKEEKGVSIWDIIRHAVSAAIRVLVVILIVAFIIWLISRRRKGEKYDNKE